MFKHSHLNESISKRLPMSIFFNIIRGLLTLLTGIFLARFLGPEEFGRMAFLLASFLAFKALLDMYSSHAFFTFLSKETRSKDFIKIYWYWMAFQLVFSLILVGLLLPNTLVASIWQNEDRILVLLALIATFMQQSAWQVASYMAEANRATVAMQKVATSVVFFHLSLIIFLFLINHLTLPIIFISISIEWAIGTFYAVKMYSGNNEKSDNIGSVFNEFWIYCKPLIPLVIFSFLYEFLDRWMLQLWGGSKEQAYYALALSFSTIILLATTSIIKIFWKEIAESYHNGDLIKMQDFYKKTSRILYFIGAFIAGFCIPWSEEILQISAGGEYIDGKTTFILMLIYPVHQCLGQINGAVLLATEKVKLQNLTGVIFIIISLLVAYYALAPKGLFIPGLNLGSQGLAWKMIIMQFLQVNIISYIIARIFKWKYDWLFQFYVLGAVLIIGFLTKFLVVNFLSSLFFSIILSFTLYIIISTICLYMFSYQILSIKNQEIITFLKEIKID